jgi:diaminopimelate epimerase
MKNLSANSFLAEPQLTPENQKFSLIEASGLGNTFLIVDCLNSSPYQMTAQQENYYRELLRISKRDSLLLIGSAVNSIRGEIADQIKQMRILELDGTESIMCGNGLRAVSEYYYQTSGQKNISVETKAGLVTAERLRHQYVSTSLGQFNYHHALPYQNEVVHYTDIGEPHAIVFTTHFQVNQLFAELGPKILEQQHNLNAVSFDLHDPSKIYNRTLERGVNHETLACGTGAVCAAVTYGQKILNERESEITVQTSSGELKVSYNPFQVKLLGPAKIEKIY